MTFKYILLNEGSVFESFAYLCALFWVFSWLIFYGWERVDSKVTDIDCLKKSLEWEVRRYGASRRKFKGGKKINNALKLF